LYESIITVPEEAIALIDSATNELTGELDPLYDQWVSKIIELSTTIGDLIDHYEKAVEESEKQKANYDYMTFISE
jgi:tRNA U34 5-carboxymethylaminomethyl modifying GTPase MnmE/TrmE